MDGHVNHKKQGNKRELIKCRNKVSSELDPEPQKRIEMNICKWVKKLGLYQNARRFEQRFWAFVTWFNIIHMLSSIMPHGHIEKFNSIRSGEYDMAIQFLQAWHKFWIFKSLEKHFQSFWSTDLQDDGHGFESPTWPVPCSPLSSI